MKTNRCSKRRCPAPWKTRKWPTRGVTGCVYAQDIHTDQPCSVCSGLVQCTRSPFQEIKTTVASIKGMQAVKADQTKFLEGMRTVLLEFNTTGVKPISVVCEQPCPPNPGNPTWNVPRLGNSLGPTLYQNGHEKKVAFRVGLWSGSPRQPLFQPQGQRRKKDMRTCDCSPLQELHL